MASIYDVRFTVELQSMPRIYSKDCFMPLLQTVFAIEITHATESLTKTSRKSSKLISQKATFPYHYFIWMRESCTSNTTLCPGAAPG